MRDADPATSERSRLELERSRTTKAIQRLIQAYQEDLVTLEDLRAAMPELRAKNTSLCNSLEVLQAQLLDQDTYLKLAENLESFLARLRDKATTATIEDRQRVLRSVVKEVLIGSERVIVRHSIPVRDYPFRTPGYRLRLRSHVTTTCQYRTLGTRRAFRRGMGPRYGNSFSKSYTPEPQGSYVPTH